MVEESPTTAIPSTLRGRAMEDCVDSVPDSGSDDATRLRLWGWREAWQRWPGWDPLQLHKTLANPHKPERELRRLAAMERVASKTDERSEDTCSGELLHIGADDAGRDHAGSCHLRLCSTRAE